MYGHFKKESGMAWKKILYRKKKKHHCNCHLYVVNFTENDQKIYLYSTSQLGLSGTFVVKNIE